MTDKHDDDCFLSGGDDGRFPCICKRATPSPAPSDTLERREAIMALHDALESAMNRKDGPHRVKAGGVWHEGPLADAYVQLVDTVQEALRSIALSLPAREVSGERALEQARAIVKRHYPEMPANYSGRRVKIVLDAFALATTPAPREKLEAALESIACPFPDGCNWEDQARACQIVALAALNRLSGEG